MPNGWPLQRMRSMRKGRGRDTFKGQDPGCEKRKKRRKRMLLMLLLMLLLMTVARTEVAS
jgi:hypothetical protein